MPSSYVIRIVVKSGSVYWLSGLGQRTSANEWETFTRFGDSSSAGLKYTVIAILAAQDDSSKLDGQSDGNGKMNGAPAHGKNVDERTVTRSPDSCPT